MKRKREIDTLPDFATYTDPNAQLPKVLRDSVNGKVKYSRIPIRRRQLKYEVQKFMEWIAHLVEVDAKILQEKENYPAFFANERTGLLIIACDMGEIIQAEFGAPEMIKKLMNAAIESDCQTMKDYEE